MELTAEVALIRDTARRAARVCVAVDRGALQSSVGEPLIAADLASQAVLLEGLAAAFPEDAVRAEGQFADLAAAGDSAVRAVADTVAAVLERPVAAADLMGWVDHRGGASARVWAVDPINGTKGFMRGEQYAVAIGLIVDGTAVLGALACPRLELSGIPGVLVWGGPGIGAFVESLGEGRTRNLAVSSVSDPARARVLGSVESAHGDPDLLRQVVDRLRIGGGWVRIDSQAKYAAVAAGMADVYLRPRNRPSWREMVWDHAAGAAIVAGAGGAVTDLDGRALDFATGDRLEDNRGVVVSNGILHAAVLAALAEIG